LPFQELLPTGGGSRQHRHGLGGGILKINESREPMPTASATGIRELIVPTAKVSSPVRLHDPEGNAVTLVPGRPGDAGITIVLAASNLQAARHHYGTALGFESLGDNTFVCGETRIELQHDPAQQPVGDMRAPGYRYLTVQVWDADKEFEAAVALGATPGMAPRTMGAVARFGFVRDPDGNWLELSQRASLTGPLPPN
jgi:catechol 2,3-dioxygenase-like lactoylglutathione lyase family enzyme